MFAEGDPPLTFVVLTTAIISALGILFKNIFLHDKTIFLTRVCSYDLDYAPRAHTKYPERLRKLTGRDRPKY